MQNPIRSPRSGDAFILRMAFLGGALWLGLAALMLGCEVRATQLIVVVNSDWSSDDLDEVQIVVGDATSSAPTKTEVVRVRRDPAGPGEVRIPFSFGVAPPHDCEIDEVRVTLTGTAGGERSVSSARAAFVCNQALRLPMYLWRACAGNPCPEGMTCQAPRGRPMCVDEHRVALPTIPGHELDGSTGADVGVGFDGGSGADAAVDDGGFDAGSDAGPDASLDAGGLPDAGPPLPSGEWSGRPLAVAVRSNRDTILGIEEFGFPLLVYEIDGAGTILRHVEIQGPGFATINAAIPMDDGGIMVTGQVDGGLLVLRLRADLQPIYAQRFARDDGRSLTGSRLQQRGGSVVVIGYADNRASYNPFIARVHAATGDLEQPTDLSHPWNEERNGYAVAELSDGDYLLAETSWGASEGLGTEAIQLTRLTHGFELVWARRVGTAANRERAGAVLADSDGGAFVFGLSGNSAGDIGSFLVLQVSAEGDVLTRRAPTHLGLATRASHARNGDMLVGTRSHSLRVSPALDLPWVVPLGGSSAVIELAAGNIWLCEQGHMALLSSAGEPCGGSGLSPPTLESFELQTASVSTAPTPADLNRTSLTLMLGPGTYSPPAVLCLGGG